MKGAPNMPAGALNRFESFIHVQDKSVSSETSPEKEEPKSPSSTPENT